MDYKFTKEEFKRLNELLLDLELLFLRIKGRYKLILDITKGLEEERLKDPMIVVETMKKMEILRKMKKIGKIRIGYKKGDKTTIEQETKVVQKMKSVRPRKWFKSQKELSTLKKHVSDQ